MKLKFLLTLRSKIIAHVKWVLKRQRRVTELSMSLNSSIIANAVQSLVTAQNDYDNALATLSNLIGLPVSDDLLIKDIAVVKSNRLPQVNAQISRTMKASAPISKLWTLRKNLPNLKPTISLRFITTTSVKPNLIRLWGFNVPRRRQKSKKNTPTRSRSIF